MQTFGHLKDTEVPRSPENSPEPVPVSIFDPSGKTRIECLEINNRFPEPSIHPPQDSTVLKFVHVLVLNATWAVLQFYN